MHETPLIIDCDMFSSFEEYVASLSKTGKKNYAYVKKHNVDLDYVSMAYDENIIKHFMTLWEQQLIRGKQRQWGFGIDFVSWLNEHKKLKMFGALSEKDYKQPSIHALHFIEVHGNYVDCHPPMYSKDDESQRYIAKYMWFNLIKWGIDTQGIKWVDLGGGNRGTWKDLIMTRQHHPNTKYKWLYIPKKIKDNPEDQPEYIVKQDKNYNRWITLK